MKSPASQNTVSIDGNNNVVIQDSQNVEVKINLQGLSLDQLEAKLKNALWEWLRTEQEDAQHPKMLLILDGFNEITVDNRELLIDLNKSWRNEVQGVQILLTSRYETNLTWTQGFQKLELQPLSREKVSTYLNQSGKSYPEEDQALQEILQVPMMLTLYAVSSEIQQAYQADDRFQFKEKVSTTGELMWNFIEAQVVKCHRQYESEGEESVAHYRWLLKHVLPVIGYEMEEQGLFEFTRRQLKEVWENYLAQLEDEEKLDLHFELFEASEAIWKKAESEELKVPRVFGELLEDVVKRLHMIKKEDRSYHFLHQNFRDFFAAAHIRNELLLSNEQGTLATILKDRPLPIFVRNMLGQMGGKLHNRPRFLEGEKRWSIDHLQPTVLSEALEQSRGVFDRERLGYINWNILTIWKEQRGDISGLDLSRLDFQKISLNGLRLSRSGLVAALSEGSISGKAILPMGHSSVVTNVAISSDAKWIVSGSEDGTVKIWDRAMGSCLDTLPNLPGLLVQGLDFRELHPDSHFSEGEIKILRQYGAIFDEEDAARWAEIEERQRS